MHKLLPVDEPITEARLVEILHAGIVEAIVAVDRQTRKIVYWNHGAEAMVGYGSQDTVGKTADLIYPDHSSFERFFDRVAAAMGERRSWRTQWQFRRCDGTSFPAEVSSTIQGQPQTGEYVVLVIREIAARKRVETESKSHARRQGAIAQLGQDALIGISMDALMKRAVSLVTQCLKVEYCGVLEFLPREKALVLRAGKGWKKGSVDQVKIGTGADSQAGYTLASDEPVVVEDLRTEKRFTPPALLREHGVVSGVTAIIHGRGHPYGIIGAHTTRPRVFRRQDIDLLRSFANILAAAIERKWVQDAMTELNLSLNDAVIERTKLIQLLQAVTAVANEAETVDNALAYTIDQVCKHLSWQVGHAYKAAEGPGMRFVSTRYWHLQDPERSAPFREASEIAVIEPDAGLFGQVLADRRVHPIEDTGEKRFLRAGPAKLAGLTSGLVLPVLVNKRVVAILEFFTTEPVRFDKDMIDVMEQIGVQLGRVVERREAEQHKHRSNYLSTLGTAASKVAHEISNPLNGMYAAVQLLERSEGARKDESALAVVHDLKSEIQRLRSLLQDFRSLSRPIKFDFEACNLCELVQELVKFHEPEYAERNIQVTCELPDGLPMVQGDKEKLKQALLNLCQNAVDAMPSGGRLTIRGHRSWDSVCLEVEDTGSGMPEGINLFEEFSTTKSGGTGLGLPIVQQIVSGHKGTLGYTSRRNHGTTFRVILPANSHS